MSNEQAVQAPKSSPHMEVEQLAYLESYDAVVDKVYAFVIYREVRPSTGKWVIRIKPTVTAGTVFDPENVSLKNALRKAAAQGEEFLVWGFNLQPKEGDPRLVENRLFFDDSGQPTKLELHLVTRKADGSPMEEQMAVVPWPA